MVFRNEMTIDEALLRFERLAELGASQLAELAAESEICEAPRGSCLLELGSHDSRLLFLLEGELELVAADGASHRVRHTDPAAQGPVSRLRPSRYRVTARSGVRYLLVESGLLDRAHEAARHSVLVEEEAFVSYTVDAFYAHEAPNELLSDSATHPLMFDVLEDLNRGRLVVPSEPDIAVRVGRALDPATVNATILGETLAVCPSLTLKTIRAAMAAGAHSAQINSCRDAVEFLGVDEAFGLAVNCVLRESLRTASKAVRKRLRSWWERTLRVSAICATLARMSDRFDPDYAALIGLLHSIAEPVLLGYADQHQDLHDPVALDNLVYENRAELGRILLTMWQLPPTIVQAASRCNQWDYDHSGNADYTDITLVAQWHASLGAAHDRRKPAASEIPAFRRVGLDLASPEASLRMVEAADSAIEWTDMLLDAGVRVSD